METSIDDLKTKGFVTMSYPRGLREAVKKAAESWKRFYNLPLEVKKALPYSNNADGVGYEYKEGIGNKADRKENFDVTLAGKKWLEENAGHIGNPIALEFIEDVTRLVPILKPLVSHFVWQVEQSYGVDGLVEEVTTGEDAFFVRFIHYFGDREVGEETASAHTDQSGFTPHLFESSPGLECLTYEGKWIPMPVSEGETVVIPSMQLQLKSQGTLKALCHRVVATVETAEQGRDSAVCFVQMKKTPKYDKDKCGRLQEKEPGFNYSMSHFDFSNLFKK